MADELEVRFVSECTQELYDAVADLLADRGATVTDVVEIAGGLLQHADAPDEATAHARAVELGPTGLYIIRQLMRAGASHGEAACVLGTAAIALAEHERERERAGG